MKMLEIELFINDLEGLIAECQKVSSIDYADYGRAKQQIADARKTLSIVQTLVKQNKKLQQQLDEAIGRVVECNNYHVATESPNKTE